MGSQCPERAKKAFRGKTECLPVPDEGSHISYGDGGNIMAAFDNALMWQLAVIQCGSWQIFNVAVDRIFTVPYIPSSVNP